MSEQRLIDLESKFSYQEKLIEELQQTIQEQCLAQIKLEKTLALLIEKIKKHEKPVHLAHEKPPHY